jgi:hypothetical protein
MTLAADDAREQIRRPRTTALLVFAVLGPPVIWAIRIMASYIIVMPMCRAGVIWPLHVITYVSVATIAAAGYAGYRIWTVAGRGSELERDGVVTRGRFLGALGMITAGFFLTVVIAEGLATAFVDPCLLAGDLMRP